jgi:hypothetical protein
MDLGLKDRVYIVTKHADTGRVYRAPAQLDPDGVNELIHPEFVNHEALPDTRQAMRFRSDFPSRWEESRRSRCD